VTNKSLIAMKKLVAIGVVSAIVFFFVGHIYWGEFPENNSLFIKIPPTCRFHFGGLPDGRHEEFYTRYSADKLHEAEDIDKYAEILRYEKMLKSYKSMGAFGEALALCLVELLLVAIFIKPVFSKKLKYILLDISLIAISVLVALFCWEWWSFMQENALLYVFIALITHYVLLRLVRPVKKYVI
jgi:hypothetical protein